MRDSLRLVVAAMVVWFGAFVAAALAVEWRDDNDGQGSSAEETSLDRLISDVNSLRAEVAELQSRNTGQSVQPPAGAGLFTPAPTEVVLAADEGEGAEAAGARYEIETIEYKAPEVGKITFIFQNITLVSGGYPAAARMVDEDGFLCEVFQETPPPIKPGEKVRFPVNFTCAKPPCSVTIQNLRWRFS